MEQTVPTIEAPLWRMALHTRIYSEAERSPSEIKLAARDCKRLLRVIESHLTTREYLAGDRISVADFNAAYTLDWARTAGLLDETPRLHAYVETLYCRPKAPPTIAVAWQQLQAEIQRAQGG